MNNAMNNAINDTDVDVEDEVYEGNDEIYDSSDTEYEFEEKAAAFVEDELSKEENNDMETNIIRDAIPNDVFLTTNTYPEKLDVVSTPESENQDGVINDNILETTIINSIEKYKQFKFEKSTDYQSLHAEIQSLIQQYLTSTDGKDAISTTSLTEHRIRLGELLNIEKKIVRKQNMNWGEYFKEKYGEKRLRSARYWMKITKKNDAIMFSFLGIERLLKVVRKIKMKKPAPINPITDFFQENNLPASVEEAGSIANFKDKVDDFLKRLGKKPDNSVGKRFQKALKEIKSIVRDLTESPESIDSIGDQDVNEFESEFNILRQTRIDNEN